jgi:hypothetical protein
VYASADSASVVHGYGSPLRRRTVRAGVVKRALSSLLVLVAVGVTSAAAALPPHTVHDAKVTHISCNVTGVWRGNGVDVAHTRWRFALTLTQRDTTVNGAFEWNGSNGDSGRERVAGRVNCDRRRLELRGVSLEGAPALALARYELTLNAAFAAFSGRWSGGIPGTLQATRDARR